jgi:ribonuclease HI
MTTVIYTDGSCNPNPGRGAWAHITLNPDGDWSVSGGELETTNNRMELMAVVEALRFHPDKKDIMIYTDSQLTMKCAEGEWKRNKNLDLWEEYDKVSKGKNVVFKKVKAHDGDKYNELVDKLASSFWKEFLKKKL